MHKPHSMLGIGLMLCAVMCLALLDATSKYLSRSYSIPMLVWARYTVHLVLMTLFLAPSMRAKLVTTARPVALALRAVMLVGTTGFSMAAFSLMPLAEGTAILFITPLAVVILAGWLLKEKISGGRWLAVCAGFAGALLVARPGGAMSLQSIVLMGLAAACYSVYQIQTRQLSNTESTVTMLFYTALVGTIVMSLAAPLYWHAMQPAGLREAAMICSLGIFGGSGHFFMTRAFRFAPASTLSPFLYAQLVWALLFGWLFYDHLPDLLSFVGMAVIAASSVWIALSEGWRQRSA